MPFFQISHVYQGIDIPLFCHRRRVYAASVYISGLFCYKPKKDGRYSSFAEHYFYVHNTKNLVCFHSMYVFII